jgi:ABC-type lipoprotein release transport system permease subunit
MAIASMVLGILWLYWVGSILALIFGYIALSQIRQRNEGGRGMAIAGVVLGWIGTGTLVLVIMLAITAASAFPS